MKPLNLTRINRLAPYKVWTDDGEQLASLCAAEIVLHDLLLGAGTDCKGVKLLLSFLSVGKGADLVKS